ncbi:hypothetical protein TUM16657_25370 [Enterobacter cloacae]|nr:hypothetical protein TUM16654_09100 [Enterobacter cloacae]GJK09943.1 hypothetical protein TUM16657_25370 [Enterobacter cloacae]GKW69755.1 hypothetical protein FJMB00501_14760 [Enterobacter hormaechei]
MLVVDQLAVAYHPPVLDVQDYPPGKIREDMQIHVQHGTGDQRTLIKHCLLVIHDWPPG